MKKKNVMRKNLLRTIKGSLGRYIAIVGIIALGASIFVGLLSTKSDMVATGQKYLDEQNMFDLRLLSTYGWTQKEVDAVADMAGVVDAEGAVSLDVIGSFTEGEKASVYKVHSIPDVVSKVYLLGGRMPENPDECLLDGYAFSDEMLGATFTVAEENEDGTLDSLNYSTYTVVGYVSSPIYMDMTRGGTSIGSGTVEGYIYLLKDAFQMAYFTEIAVTIEGNYAIYTEEFTKAMENMAEELKPGVTVLAQDRFASLKADAEQEYQDGYKEYEEGLADYEKGREEALQKLADGLKELQDGQAEIDENRLTLEDGLKQLEEGQRLLDEQAAQLIAGRQELADNKAQAYAALAAAYAELMENYKTVSSGLKQVEAGIAQTDDGLIQLDQGIAMIRDGLIQLEDGLEQLELVISLLEVQVEALELLLDTAASAGQQDSQLVAQLQEQLAAAQTNLDTYVSQRDELIAMGAEYTAQLEALEQQRVDVVAQRAELVATKKTLDEAMAAIEDGMLELESNQVQAENQFAAAEAQLESGQIQLDAAQKELDAKLAEAQEGLKALEEAQIALDEGWAEYEAGKAEAEAELADAKAQLDDAAAQLADARETIDTMAQAEVFILDRNTNAGYLALDSNSDIVAGVSRVFPAFFLLVAALVCITTMTRMVEEERTQIGTFKALGYSGGKIVRKYLFYAGSAAIVGCGLGVLLGSVIFPMILWDVYGLLLNITPTVVLELNWPLCIAVVGAYTIVMLAVTWYCCHRTLREVPAELIRPKAPTSGKKIWLEYLPFWKRIGFLNKVMLRNVFRYRQRMLMMLVGIGGCTALLLTGFGLRDSIVNTVPDQFENVMVYDLEVYFGEGQTAEDQLAFREELRKDVSGVHFFYQSSADLDFGSSVSDVYLIASNENVRDFFQFVQDGETLSLPGKDEAFISVGVAEKMGIGMGDTIILRDPDMRQLAVTVTGIFHNNVNNYAVVSPETMEAQWGEMPMDQMAYVNIREFSDMYAVAAAIMAMDGVMNVSIMEDLAETVNTMLGALDTVVVVIVICAGALAMIVLYNLTNINITERIREIATIKVLGFHSGESAAYVFKENLLLSGMGTIVGLFLGYWLLAFVISQIKVDIIWITPQVTALSCVISVVLTMLSACLVDFLLYFKLEKINMAEALKSVE